MEFFENKNQSNPIEYSLNNVEDQVKIVFENLKENFEKLNIVFDISEVVADDIGVQTLGKNTKNETYVRRNLSCRWVIINIDCDQDFKWNIEIRNVGDLGYRIILFEKGKKTNLEINENGDYKFIEIFDDKITDVIKKDLYQKIIILLSGINDVLNNNLCVFQKIINEIQNKESENDK